MHKLNQEQLSNNLDLGIVISTCLALFFLPISIALVESFSGFVILFYFLKVLTTTSKSLNHVNQSGVPNIVKRELYWRTFRKNLILPKHPIRLALIILMLVTFLTVVASQDRVTSFVAYVGKFLQDVFFLLAIFEGFRKKEHLLWAGGVFIFITALVSLSGLVQLYTGHDFLRGNPLASDGRVSSSLRHANDLGVFLIVGIGVILAFIFLSLPKMNKRFKVLLCIILAMVLLVLMYTYSRSAWLGLLFLVALAILFDRRYVKASIAIALVLFMLFLPALKKSRHVFFLHDQQLTALNMEHDSEAEGKYSTMTGRMTGDTPFEKFFIMLSQFGGSGRAEYWEKAIKVIQTAPVLGTGLNTYSKQVEKIPGFWGGGYAHNCYLQMTAETGLMGITAFLYFIINLLCYSVKSWFLTDDSNIKTSLVFIMCAIVGYLVQSFF